MFNLPLYWYRYCFSCLPYRYTGIVHAQENLQREYSLCLARFEELTSNKKIPAPDEQEESKFDPKRKSDTIHHLPRIIGGSRFPNRNITVPNWNIVVPSRNIIVPNRTQLSRVRSCVVSIVSPILITPASTPPPMFTAENSCSYCSMICCYRCVIQRHDIHINLVHRHTTVRTETNVCFTCCTHLDQVVLQITQQ